MSDHAASWVAAARSGIQRRKQLGLPEPTHDYGIERDSGQKYLGIMLSLQSEFAKREAGGVFATTAPRQ
jgi:hypothetical protein